MPDARQVVDDIIAAFEDAGYDEEDARGGSFAFGFRYDERDLPLGYELEPSFEWFQDEEFEGLEYDEGRGMWRGEELEGTSSVGFDVNDERSVADALALASRWYGTYGNLYVVFGRWSGPGSDPGELLISDAVVLLKY